MRAAGLVCLGASAGLIRADLRAVRGTDISCRSGGVLVNVRGSRPRAVPVLARYHQALLASAQFAGEHLVTGGTDPGIRSGRVTSVHQNSPRTVMCPAVTGDALVADGEQAG